MIRSLLILVLLASSALSGESTELLRQDNLVAWCVVPFDAKGRSPAERAAMLKRLRFTKLAYDWREKHVAEFEDEINQLKKHGIEFFAFWGEHPKMFELFETHKIHPQVWKMLPQPSGKSQVERVESAAKSLLPLVERTRTMGCKLGIYNHGGWSGEPANMAAVCKSLRKKFDAAHVGIVYNFHHGHDHIADFAKHLDEMLPYLLCVNINGMNSNGQPKILPVGKGEHESAMMRTLTATKYRGPIGILDHRNETDTEVALKANLDGLARMNLQADLPPKSESSSR